MLKLRNPWKKLEKALGYRFRRRALLENALMHRSFRFEQPDVGCDNQRLEFLGDAVLGLLAAAHLYDHGDEKDEGTMTTMRSRIASSKALADIARDIGLGEYLKIGKGEEASGGRKRRSILADALEAVVAAVYLDGGMKGATRVYNRLFVPVVDGLEEDAWAGNPKGRLQELSQRRWHAGPVYRVISRTGPPHEAVFCVEVLLNGDTLGRGQGRSKQEAERRAAAEALAALARGVSPQNTR